MNALVPAHEPLLGQIQRSTVDHLAGESIAEAHGGVMGGTEMSARMEVQTNAIVQTDLDAWYDMLWSAAGQLARQQMRYLLASMDVATQRTGNAVNMQGAPISHDAVLDLLERMDFEVDANGLPDGLTMVVAPSTADQIANLGPMTPQQEQRFQQIIAEKRRVQDAKKRVRRLDRRPG